MTDVDVAPYLKREDGMTPIFIPMTNYECMWKDIPFLSRNEPAVDAVVDMHGKSLCVLCTIEIFPGPHLAGTAFLDQPRDADGHCPRVWWFARRLTDAERERMLAYLADPRCSTEAHAGYENTVREREKQRLEDAQRRWEDFSRKPAGWSLTHVWDRDSGWWKERNT